MSRVTLGMLRRLPALGTRHPAWRQGFAVRAGHLPIQNGWRVTAIDASGAEFGFGVGAGWPEAAKEMAEDLAVILNALHETRAANSHDSSEGAS
jgi:hypothetical protein